MPPPDRIGAYIKRMEKEGVARVKMFLVITVAYLIFWGPLFLVTLFNWSWEWVDAKKSMAHEVGVVLYLLTFSGLKKYLQKASKFAAEVYRVLLNIAPIAPK